MHELKDLELTILMDMLAAHTTKIMRLITECIFDGEEYTNSNNFLQTLQTEIRRRKEATEGFSTAAGISTGFAEKSTVQSPPMTP